MNFQKDNRLRQWDHKSFGNMGTNLHPMQGNQLQQLNQMISAGPGGSEIITLQRNVWETIPKEHFKEMGRLSTLTGVEPSVHAPIVEPGLSNAGQGNTTFDEEHRLSEIRFINDVLDRSIDLVDKHHPRNVPVNIHPDATGRPTIWRIARETIKEDDGTIVTEKGKGYKELDWAVDRQTGQTTPLKFEVKYYPPQKPGQEEQKMIWTPEKKLENLNLTTFEKEVAGTFGNTEFQMRQLEKIYGEKGFTSQAQTLAKQLSDELNSKMHELYDDVRKTSDFEEQNWYKLPEEKRNNPEMKKGKEKYDELKKTALDENKKILKSIEEMRSKIEKTENEDEKRALASMANQLQQKEVDAWAGFFNGLMKDRDLTPKKFTTFDEFALEKMPDTFARAAIHSLEAAQEKSAEYAKQGVHVNPIEIAPLVNIENMPANQYAFGRADALKNLVEASRAKTAELLMKEKGMSKGEAEKIADKIIGVTWDVGHINMLRPAGFGDKEILQDVKTIGPFVRHFHVTDNFGTTDAHLVPGQGNAIPLKQLETAKKAAAEAGKPLEKVKEIMEIGGFVEHHKTSPWPYTLSYFNSPIYETEAGPAWSETSQDLGSNYFFGSSEYVTGMGNILPEAHFGMYGSGFSGLPTSFGAPLPGGERSRFAGAPMS